MHTLSTALEPTAPLAFLPVISALAIVAGLFLLFGRHLFRLVRRRDKPASIGKNPAQGISRPDSDGAVSEQGSRGTIPEARNLFETTLWFGLVAGWLELALVLVRRTIDPHIHLDMLRTNRHYVWMIPVSDLLVFSVVGLLMVPVARFRPGLARWTASRLPVGLACLTLLLSIEGLHPVSDVVLAGGLALTIGRWLERRTAGLGRLVRFSLPVMAVSLAVLTALNYRFVKSGEERSLSLCPPAKPGLPNVMLIVLDNVRAASMSLHGYTRPTTPNLERLARRGILFSEARSTAPWTLPSHASMLTGRWPHELSAGWDRALDATFPTLAEVLGREGYATAGFVGNVIFCSSRFGLDRGFARYVAAYENQTVSVFETIRSSGLGKRVIQALGYPIRLADGDTSVRKTAAMLNRDALHWLAERPVDRPFFLFINYYDAHRPYVLHDNPERRFGLAALPFAEQEDIDKRFQDLVGKTVPADLGNQQVVNDGFKVYQDCYDSCIAYGDRQVGLLLDEIERRGLLKNTLVIVTSDHGEQIGEHGVMGHGASLYRPEVHVPLLLIPPAGLATAKVVDDPVSIRELPATVAEYIKLGARSPFPGRSLARYAAGTPGRRPETSPVLCEVERNKVLPRTSQIPSSRGAFRSLVVGDRVYVRGDEGQEELYDRVHDELESVDLARYPQSQPEVARLRRELSRLCHDVPTSTR